MKIIPSKPQSGHWHAMVHEAVLKARGDSDALLMALEPLQIRGMADGYEFEGYDYRAQCWVLIQGYDRDVAHTFGAAVLAAGPV